jgi:hypothetical protein
MADDKKILSIHVKRDKAREKERRLQALLDRVPEGSLDHIRKDEDMNREGIPGWAQGVKVDPVVGGLLHAVVATRNRGH